MNHLHGCYICGDDGPDVTVQDGFRLCATCRARLLAVTSGAVRLKRRQARPVSRETEGPLCRSCGAHHTGRTTNGRSRPRCKVCTQRRKSAYQKRWRAEQARMRRGQGAA